VTTKKVARKVGYFSAALLLSSTAWNRYIAYYQDILEKNDVTAGQFARQNYAMKVNGNKKSLLNIYMTFPSFSVYMVLYGGVDVENCQCTCTSSPAFAKYFL
jgi:hypothetical protein